MKILLADDEHFSRRLMERMLQSIGYDVPTAENGREAMERLSLEEGPRLALLDWMMPELDGLDVCRAIRSRCDKPYVYILLLTARTDVDDIVTGLKAGADGYLTKPCSSAELQARLHTGRRILELEDKLVESREAMRFQATHDALTSVLNRGAALAQIQNVLNLSRTSRSSISLLLCDIDHFKQVNDTHGHLVGDEVLRQLSGRMSSCTRSGDIVGRYGGEEFLILLTDREANRVPRPGQKPFDGDIFLHRAEQIRQAVRSSPFSTHAGPLSISVSIGAITIAPKTTVSPVEIFLARADGALYRAKAAGRDRALFAEPLVIPGFGEELASIPLSSAI